MEHNYIKLTYKDKIRFGCLRCGRCCSSGPNVGLTAFDIHRIARFLDLNWRELKGRYIIAVIADMIAIPTIRDIGGGRCVFLEYINRQPSCSIYPVRPIRCRLYPFIPPNLSKERIVYVDRCCPGLDTGAEIDPPWRLLEEYRLETKIHYSKLYRLIFEEGYQPLNALERIIEDVKRTKTFRREAIRVIH